MAENKPPQARKRKAEDSAHPESCREWLAKKNRFCTQPKIAGSERCQHHQADPAANATLVSCPLCGDQMRAAGNKLAKHMKKCNAAKKADYSGVCSVRLGLPLITVYGGSV